MDPLASVTELPASVWRLQNFSEWRQTVPLTTRWIVPGFIPKDSLVLISGQQKLAFKTWTADTLAISMSTGKQLGPFAPLEPVPVLYIQEEGSKQGTKGRIDGIAKTYGIDPNDLKFYFVFRERIKLDNDLWRRRLIGAIRHLGIEVLILDALTYMHDAEENSNAEMGVAIETMRIARGEGVTVIFLAHLDKDRGSRKKADIDNQLRGASVVVNAYDVHFALRRYSAKDAHIDLTLRAREQEERQFVVTWDIVKHTEAIFDPHLEREVEIEVIDKAKLDMRELGSEGEVGTRLEKFLLAMAPGKLYSADELRACWGCGGTISKSSRERLVADGRIVVEKGKFKLSPIDASGPLTT